MLKLFGMLCSLIVAGLVFLNYSHLYQFSGLWVLSVSQDYNPGAGWTVLTGAQSPLSRLCMWLVQACFLQF